MNTDKSHPDLKVYESSEEARKSLPYECEKCFGIDYYRIYLTSRDAKIQIFLWECSICGRRSEPIHHYGDRQGW